MKVKVELNAPIAVGKFATTKLAISQNAKQERKVDVKIDFQSLCRFNRNTKSISFDFFFIASIVYSIDCLLSRHTYSIDGWAREIEVEIPVNNPKIWNNNKDALKHILSFLTGDYWTVSFRKSGIDNYYVPTSTEQKLIITDKDLAQFTFASLFSGGLDSLVGVIDFLENTNNSKGLLISHFDSTSPGTNQDQVRLNGYLSKPAIYGNKYNWVQTKVALSNTDNYGQEVDKESSLRSRSILFIAIAVHYIEALPNCNTLYIPENGTISVNFPLTPSRSSTLSTRTTHPYYLKKLQNFLLSIGLNTILENPYEDMTKGEVVSNCHNIKILKGIYEQSVSCGKRGRKQHWDTKVGLNHCGVCMPCIYRRAALHTIGLDNQKYGIDLFYTPKPILSIEDMPALFDFLNRNDNKEQIKKVLSANGSYELDELDSSSELVMKVRDEIKKWISEKGNKTAKQLIGIR